MKDISGVETLGIDAGVRLGKDLDRSSAVPRDLVKRFPALDGVRCWSGLKPSGAAPGKSPSHPPKQSHGRVIIEEPAECG